ncbi:ABC transporter permease [Candidatus Thorarchaeota archaeon]|nr:MAG: ABC transporter permease [Candidatus Thorarchaeota archaeon]
MGSSTQLSSNRLHSVAESTETKGLSSSIASTTMATHKTIVEEKIDTKSTRRFSAETENPIFKIVTRFLVPLILLILIWSIVAWISGGITLVDVADAFVRLLLVGDSEGNTLLRHTGQSLYRVLLGFLVALATGIPLGIAIGRYKLLDSTIGPVVEAMRPIPPIAWIPLSILLFSQSFIYSQVFIIWIGAFFPILINTTAGVKRTNPVHIDVAETFGASERQILGSIVVPSAAPEIFAGLRVGFGIGWMCLVAAEMIGGGLGLGYLVLIMQQVGRTGAVITGMIVIGVIGFGLSYLFLYIERKLLVWRQEVSV